MINENLKYLKDTELLARRKQAIDSKNDKFRKEIDQEFKRRVNAEAFLEKIRQ